MKTFYVPIYWCMSSTVKIEAKSKKEALEKAFKKYNNLPEDGECVDGSFDVDEELIEEGD